jgi:hypothetical protein
MNKEASKIIGMIEAYLRESANIPLEEKPTPKEIEFNITRLLIDKDQVEDLFTIEVIPLNDSYMLRTRNQYTSLILGAMPSFCKICGKLLGKSPCQHEQ